MNLLLVCLDDCGLEQFSLHGQGSNYPAMPNVAAVANNGVRFDRFHVISSCSGTRACYYTGRYADRNGIGEALEITPEGTEVPELHLSEITFADFLKFVGAPHQTALIGKDHVFTGGNTENPIDQPQKQGFDYWNGQVRNIPANVSLGRGYYNWDKRTVAGEFVSYVYNTTDIINEAIAWIDQRNALGEPWVCFVNFHACHNPMDPERSQPPIGLYDTVTWGNPPAAPNAQWKNMKATLEAADAEFGRLMTHVDLADTTVFVLSDNGTESERLPIEVHPDKGQYPTSSGKRTLFDPGIRAPLYVQGAGVTTPGRVNTDLWHVVDLYQTWGELLGYDPKAWLSDVTKPRRPKRVLDSVSLKHVLDNVAGETRDSVVFGLFSPNLPNALSAPGQRGVVYNDGSILWKLIVNPSYVDQTGTPGRQFFNLTQLDIDDEFEQPNGDLLLGGADPSVLTAAQLVAYNQCQAIMADLAASIQEHDLQFIPTTSEYPT